MLSGCSAILGHQRNPATASRARRAQFRGRFATLVRCRSLWRLAAESSLAQASAGSVGVARWNNDLWEIPGWWCQPLAWPRSRRRAMVGRCRRTAPGSYPRAGRRGTHFDTAASRRRLSEEHSVRSHSRRMVEGHRRNEVPVAPRRLTQPGAAIRASVEASPKGCGANRSTCCICTIRSCWTVRLAGARPRFGVGRGDAACGRVQAGLTRHAGFTVWATARRARGRTWRGIRNRPAYFHMLNLSAGFAGHAGGQQDFDGSSTRLRGRDSG